MRKYDMEHFERLFMTGELDGKVDDDKGGKGDEGEKKDEPTTAELQKQIVDLKKEKEAILANKDEILAEKKKRDREKADADEKVLKADAEKAERDKDFAAYKKSHDEQIQKKDDELKAERAIFNRAQVDAESMRIASRLAEGDNVELLSEFITRRLRYEDGSIQILSATGELTAQTLKDLENEFTNTAKFASLLKGRKSSGGGAGGGSGGGSTQEDQKLFGASRMAAARSDTKT